MVVPGEPALGIAEAAEWTLFLSQQVQLPDDLGINNRDSFFRLGFCFEKIRLLHIFAFIFSYSDKSSQNLHR